MPNSGYGRGRAPNALKDQRYRGQSDPIVSSAAAVTNGFMDSLPFDLANMTYAALRAMNDAAARRPLGPSYAARIEHERQRDRYEAQRYPIARTAGEVAGVGAQLAAAGPVEGALLGGSRLAAAARLASEEERIALVTPRLARETAALAGTGALAGAGGQALVDTWTGRQGDLGDYLAAAGGGATTALLATHGVPTRFAAAGGGAAGSLADDALHHRALSPDAAVQAASTGNWIGAAGNAKGRLWADDLSRPAKERLGEIGSQLRTAARGERTVSLEKRGVRLDNGRVTLPDQRSSGPQALVESKFGRSADLSPNQRYAAKSRTDYRVDHFLPRDVGAVAGSAAAIGLQPMARGFDRRSW